MAAMIVMSGAVLVIVNFFSAEAREIRGNHEKFAAQLLAESEIERLRTLAYEDIPLGLGQAVPATLPSAGRLKDCRIFMDVSEPEPGLKQATVRVQWSSSRGRPLGVSQVAVYAKEARRR